MLKSDIIWGPNAPFGLTSSKLLIVVAVLTVIMLLISVLGPEFARRGDPDKRTALQRWVGWLSPLALSLFLFLLFMLVFQVINREGWFYSSFMDLFGS